MTGYKVKFNGIDRLYDAYSWRLTRRAKKAWETGQVLQGPYLQSLEAKIADKYQRKFAVGVGSATDGLYFAMKAIGLNKDSVIGCPVFSFIATAGAIRRLGARIEYLDIDQVGCLAPIKTKNKLDAVVYVNLYGNLANYDSIKTFCNGKNIPLIEDAAQSNGANYHGIPSGKLGDISVFSFDPTKNLPCFGSGGMVLTDNADVYDKLKSLRRHGTGTKQYGYNSFISEDHANQLLFLLEKFEDLQKRREQVFKRYNKKLPNIEFLTNKEKGLNPSYHKCVIMSNERDKLKSYLDNYGIETKIHYPYLLDKTMTHHYPMAELIQAQCLSLPIYPFMKNSDIDYICNRIKTFYGI
jgi:dTDP-4-amino-4,6-dideoxygalactose transaminase